MRRIAYTGPSSRGRRGVASAAIALAVLAVPCPAQTAPAAGGVRPVAAETQAGPDRAPAGDRAIRPFRIEVPQAALDDLRRRIAATRWPERETVADQSQGVQLATLQELVRYWGTDYDWRRAEARLNALPQFVTTIDGLDIQFIHVRSRHADALPLIMTHGWPGSPLELLKVIGPLTDPTAHGGRAEDAFHLVLPTYPGYGFSGKPQGTGWGPPHVAQAWHELMQRLGYTRYVSQGGDWGAIISQVMAVQAPPGLLGIHTNMPGTVPPEVVNMVRTGQPVPAEFSDAEKAAYASLDVFYNQGFGYAAIMNTRPQTIGYSLADSPVGMAAFFYEKIATWTESGGQPERVLTRDEILDDITLYWLTNTGTSSSRSYWDGARLGGGPFTAVEIPTVPVAVTVFPGEIYRAPRSWGERSFKNLIYWNEADRGGHFAAWEQPHSSPRKSAPPSARCADQPKDGIHTPPRRNGPAPRDAGRSGRGTDARRGRGGRDGQARHRAGARRLCRRVRMTIRHPADAGGRVPRSRRAEPAGLTGGRRGDDKAVIDAQTGPVVVVGHSYGGAVISGAAAGNPNVRALVYIAAFITSGRR